MKQIIVLIAMIAVLSSMTSAVTCSIDAKTEVRAGEELFFSYTISSTEESEVIYMPQISCPGNMPSSVLKEKWALADKKGKISGKYSSGNIDSSVKTQECTARITILKPVEIVCEKKIKISTLPAFDLLLNACKETTCTKKQRTFVKGENVYLQASSKEAVSATASITFPDAIKKTIALPGSFTASQSGEYNIGITATKKGYKDFISSASIFVIERAYTVPYADFSSKAGQAVVRPVFKEPALISPMTAAKTVTEEPPLQKRTFKSFFRRITGFFMRIF